MTLEINKIVEVCVEGESGVETYPTRVEDVADESVTVAAPLDNGSVVPLRQGQMVSLEYWDTDPKREGRYSAKFCIIRRYVEGSLPMLDLEPLGVWSRIQERDFVRVDVSLDAHFVVYAGDYPQGSRPCRVSSLSGGGLLLVVEESLPLDTCLLVVLYLDSGTVRLGGKVVRVETTEFGIGHGVSFGDIDDKARQEIIQYVFRRQLESRRKGLV